MKKTFIVLSVLALVTARPLAAQDSRAATVAEQRQLEVEASREAMRRKWVPPVFLLDPRLFDQDIMTGNIWPEPWEVAWGRRTDSSRVTFPSVLSVPHTAGVAQILGLRAIADISPSCIGRLSQCAVDTLQRVIFSPAVVRGDSAQIQLYEVTWYHVCEDPARRSRADMVRQMAQMRFLLVKVGGSWTVTSVKAPVRPDNAALPCRGG